jgi:hypothetical protein
MLHYMHVPYCKCHDGATRITLRKWQETIGKYLLKKNDVSERCLCGMVVENIVNGINEPLGKARSVEHQIALTPTSNGCLCYKARRCPTCEIFELDFLVRP